MGAAGALGGAGTTALLSDTEKSKNNVVTAGKLDLKVDWVEHYNGEKIEEQPLTDNPGPIFDLDDVKPGDHGEATISLHVYDNPAFVHLGGKLTSNGESNLADEILVDVWYDGTDPNGGNNKLDPGERIISSGTLSEVLGKLENGVLLDDQTSNGGSSPGALQNGTEVTATFCGEFQGGPQEEQCIDCIPCEDPDVLGTPSGLSDFCYTPEGGLPEGTTHVTLKAAQGCYLAEVSSSTDTICLPDENPTGEPNLYGEISNATFYRCDGDNGNGDGKKCWPNSTTQYIGFSWELPKDVGNEVQSDSASFDLKSHAQQCRHNKNPDNPFDD